MTATLQSEVSEIGPEQSAARPADPVVLRDHDGLRPSGRELVDAGLLLLLTVLALGSFHNAYGGTRYLIVGVIGAVVGMVVAHLCARTRQPALVTAAAGIAAFLLFGPAVAVPDRAFLGFLPSPAAVTALIDGAVGGWARLLTTLPPVGAVGSLLVVPFLCGLLCGLLALTLSRRTSRPLTAILPPVSVLVLGILFGTSRPVSVLLQGTVFGAVALLWASLRAREQRRGEAELRARRRWGGVVATLLVAVLVSLVLGPALPGVGSNPRFVLRDRSQPPFDPQDHPSPLASFRRYQDPGQLGDLTLFVAEGLREGDRLRLATMDEHDGVVYAVSDDLTGSGQFRRTGTEIDAPVSGDERDITITVDAYNDVWVPGMGFLSGMQFEGDSARARTMQEAFVYNTATGAAASTLALEKGDAYSFTAVVPQQPSEEERRTLGSAEVELPPPPLVPGLDEAAATLIGEDGTAAPYERLVKLSNELRATGGKAEVTTNRPGHGVDRMLDMLDPAQSLSGDDEQFATLLSLMARSQQLPTRVVLGVAPKVTDGKPVEVKGTDMRAWVEIALDGAGWVPLYEVTPEKPDVQKLPEQKQNTSRIDLPPPPLVLPVTEEDETDANKAKAPSRKGGDQLGGGIPGVVFAVGGVALTPFLIIGGVTAAIAGIKQQRRNRRRTRGGPTERIAGGWDEVTDLAADLGAPVPMRVTRQEAATLIGTDAVDRLALHADGRIFGPGVPSEDQVEDYWQDVDQARSSMTDPLSRFERWKATVSLSSLRASWTRSRSARRVDGAAGSAAAGGDDVEESAQ